MKRGTLQLWTLVTWVAGLGLLELTVVIAALCQVDRFAIDDAKLAQFEDQFVRYPETDPLHRGLAPAIAILKQLDHPNVHNVEDFGAFINRALPTAPPQMIQWWRDNGGHDILRDYYPALAEFYIPWLAMMLAGVFKEQIERESIARYKAYVSLFTSIALQLFLFVVLYFNLFHGAASEVKTNVRPASLMAASLVGILVQFVFPSGAGGAASTVPGKEESPPAASAGTAAASLG